MWPNSHIGKATTSICCLYLTKNRPLFSADGDSYFPRFWSASGRFQQFQAWELGDNIYGIWVDLMKSKENCKHFIEGVEAWIFVWQFVSWHSLCEDLDDTTSMVALTKAPHCITQIKTSHFTQNALSNCHVFGFVDTDCFWMVQGSQ